MGESPKFEHPTTPEEENKLILARSEYLLEQLGLDRLTGLKNRTFFENELEKSLKTIRDKGEDHHRSGGESLKEISIIFVDLDNFKKVNDTFGHLKGDEVLKRIAKILNGSVRESDVVARFGGDEFYILLPRTDEDIAIVVANKIKTNLENDPTLQKFSVTEDDLVYKVGASFGISSSHMSTDTTDLIKYADDALFTVKGTGKNRIEVYKP